MAAVGTAFNWVLVSGGVWTRIWQGPLVTIFPFQALELGGSAASTTIRWTLDGYSAVVPFYQRHGGTTIAPNVGGPGNPIGHTGLYATVLSYHVSPWVEFWLLPNVRCFAHIAVM